MADLENLLLEAAGRTGVSSKKNLSHSQARRRPGGQYSDDDSDSGSDDGPGNRKRPGSQIPLKKRFDPPEKDGRGSRDDDEDEDDDDDREGSNDSDSDLSVGSDLYKDDEDREKLSKMSELEREIILAERATKRDDYNLKKKVKASSSKSDRKDTREVRPLPSRFSRSANRSDRKDDALNELRAKRLKQQDPEGFSRMRDTVGVGSLRDSSPAKNRRLSVPASPSDSSSSESGGSKRPGNQGFAGADDLVDSDDDSEASGGDPLTFDDIKAITIRRSKLAKWFMEPFFEELIAGCFVRLGIGMTRSGQRIYRLCMVKNVDATDPDRQYKMENKTTHKYLNCVWGNDTSAARWQMARVSDAPPLEEEFKALIREIERSGGQMPAKEDVLEKLEAIRKINNFVYSAATVKQMLQEKKSASLRPLNVAAEKDRLRKQMEKAESRGDEAEMERIKARLKELEEMSQKHKEKDSKAVRLAEMNRKNRAENFRRASEMKPVNTSLKAGEAGYDPFSRRWTRSRNYYVSKPGGDNQEAEAANPSTVAKNAEAGAVATAAALEAAADAGKLVDTSAPVDLGTESNMLHNFELPISLAGLQKFGGAQGVFAGFMARKQKIEATIGYKVPENDGRRHALTLTVGDYKRRRGLL